MANVSLLVGGQVFIVNKELLCEHSDYFRAMFSGNYVENDKQEISIDVINVEAIKIMLEYMNTGLSDLNDYSLSAIKELGAAANFLQITELMKQIECILSSKEMSPENCMQIMSIAENSAFTHLEQQCATYALLSFRYMKPEYIPDITRLCWYLSHPYLDAPSELNVFDFGLMWILQNDAGDDALLILLGCLDIEKLTLNDVSKIVSCLSCNQNSLAADVTECLHNIAEVKSDLSMDLVQLGEMIPKELYTERVYNETMNLIKESQSRLPTYTLVVALSKPELNFYIFTDNGFENWITFPYKYSPESLHEYSLSTWLSENFFQGWNVVAWGLMKIVVFVFNANKRSLKIYDVLEKKWTCHDTTFNYPPHHGLQESSWHAFKYTCGQIIGDSLYLITCSNGNTFYTTIYNLKTRTYTTPGSPTVFGCKWKIAVCSHEGNLYAAGYREICKYEVWGSAGCWRAVVETGFLVNTMASFKGFIYCTQSHTNNLYRFRPGLDEKLNVVTRLTSPPSYMCNMGNRLLFFTTSTRENNAMNVEEYYGITQQEKPRVLWCQKSTSVQVKDVVSCCPLVMAVPPLNCDTSHYAIEYLKKYKPYIDLIKKI